MTKKTVTYYSLTDLVPKAWDSWFYEVLALDYSVSWGDADHTLIAASTFKDMAAVWDWEGVSYTKAELEEYQNNLKLLKVEDFVDLEN